MYGVKDLKDPYSILKRDVQIKKQRIQTLSNDYQVVNHYFAKAIIEVELENLVRDYLEQSFILQKIDREESNTKEWTWLVKIGFRKYEW